MPHNCIIGDSIVTNLLDETEKVSKFTDIQVQNKKGYFIIAAPST